MKRRSGHKTERKNSPLLPSAPWIPDHGPPRSSRRIFPADPGECSCFPKPTPRASVLSVSLHTGKMQDDEKDHPSLARETSSQAKLANFSLAAPKGRYMLSTRLVDGKEVGSAVAMSCRRCGRSQLQETGQKRAAGSPRLDVALTPEGTPLNQKHPTSFETPCIK